MRRRPFFLGLGAASVAAVAMAVLPAQAANVTVIAVANGFSFTPTTVSIDVGDTVTWTHSGGFAPHNVKFDDNSFDEPANATGARFTVSRKFDAPGTFRYYCEQHGGPGGTGMAGVVIVREPGTGPPPDTMKPVLTTRAFQGAFKPLPARITFQLSEPARVVGTLTRRPLRRGSTTVGTGTYRAFGSARVASAKQGPNTLRLTRTTSGRRLTPGEYKLSLRATDAASNVSAAKTTRFVVKP